MVTNMSSILVNSILRPSKHVVFIYCGKNDIKTRKQHTQTTHIEGLFLRCSIRGSSGDLEILLLLMLLYLFRETEARTVRVVDLRLPCLATDLCGRHSQVGSLAEASHLLNDNAGVLR